MPVHQLFKLLILSLALVATASCATAHIATPPTTTRPADEIETLQLMYADARESSQILHDLLDVFATADTQSNIVIVKGPPERVKAAHDLLMKFDSSGPDNMDQTVLFIHHLKNENAVELAGILQSMVQSGFFVDSDHPSAPPALRVAADPRTNSLILSMDRRIESEIRYIVTDLDAPIDKLSPTSQPK